MANHGLVGADAQLISVLAKDLFEGNGFAQIVTMGGGAVSVDIINLFGFHASIINSSLYAGSRGFAGRVGSSDVVSIAVHCKASQLSINVCATSLSMLQLFQNQHTSALAQYEAIALLVEGAGSLFRVLVIGGQCLHVSKASNSNGRNSCFGATSQHYIGITILNGAQSVANAVGAGCAGSNNSSVRTLQTAGNSDLTSGHIGNFHGDEEGADFGGALSAILQGLVQEGMDAANAAANAYATAHSIFLAHIQLSILDSQFSSSNCQLGYAVHAFAFFFVDISSVIKVLYFCSNLNSKALSIKLGNGAYARLAGNQIAPKGFLADTNRSNRANTGYYNSSFTQNYSPRS